MHSCRATKYTSALEASVSGLFRDLRPAINLVDKVVISAMVWAGRPDFDFPFVGVRGKLMCLLRCCGCVNVVDTVTY